MARAMSNKKFWEFRNSAEKNGAAELILYGSISSETWYGDEVTPKTFSDELKALGDIPALTVRINSGGGDVFAAMAIHDRLCDLRKNGVRVEAVVDGWAASAATIICMGADKISIPNTAVFMIHDPMVGAFGYYNAEQLDELMDKLGVIKKSIVAAYAAKTGKTAEDIGKAMSDETWYVGQEAVDSGFCDELITSAAPTVENRSGHVYVNAVEMENIPEEILERITALKNTQEAEPVMNTADRSPAAIGKNITNDMEGNEMAEIKNVGDLKAAYPELCKEIVNEAVKGERERIKAIDDATVAGFEDVAQDAKYKDCITAEAMAVRVLGRIKNQGVEFLDKRAEDANNSGMSEVGSTAAPDNGEDDEKAFNQGLDRVFAKK